MKRGGKIGFKNTRVRDFLIFLFLSFMAWMVSRMSESFVYETAIPTTYAQIPDSLILMSDTEEALAVKIRASGFQILRHQLSSKKFQLNLNAVRKTNERYFLTSDDVRRQFGRQWGAGSTLLELEVDTLYVSLEKLASKWVPIVPEVHIEFAQNYMLDGPLGIEPERVRILGPTAEIDTVIEIKTPYVSLADIHEDVRLELKLEPSTHLPNTRLSTSNVLITGSVFRFTETMIAVPVTVVNLPKDLLIKTFPPTVDVLCRGRVESLKEIAPDEFKVIADFGNPDMESGRLKLELAEFPTRVHDAVLQQHSAEFIVRRE